MGILDSFQFSPQTYGSNDPLGWLGMLLNSQPGQSQGFQDQLPPQATPAMGQRGPGVNLPQMDATGYGKDPSASNPLSGLLGMSGPSPGMAAAPGPTPTPPVGPGPGLGNMGIGLLNHLQAGAANLTGSGNPLAGIINAIGGLATGQRTDATGYMLQQQRATYQALKPALLGRGASEVQAEVLARAASMDPEIKKTIVSTLYQPPQLVSGGTNPLTGEITHQVYNPNSQTLSNLGATAQGDAAQTLTPANAAAIGLPAIGNNELSKIQQLNQSGITGDEYLAKLKEIAPSYASKANSMAQGDIAYPSGFIMKTPYGALLTDSISAIRPGITAQDYPSKQAAQKSWTSGPDAGAVKSLNQAIVHSDKAWNMIDKLPNLNVGGYAGKFLNVPYTQAVAALSPQYASDVKEYQRLVQALAGELMTASRGSGHGSVEEIRAWKEGADSAGSPAEMRGAIRGAMDFLEGAMGALANKKTAAFKSQKQISGDELLQPEQKKQFEKIHNSFEGSAQGSTSSSMLPLDKQALDWANANPTDPRATKIKQRLEVQ